eukprot:gene3065-5235_t
MSFVKSFPNPPEFYKNYGDDKMDHPLPPPPIEGDYKVFGETIPSNDILRRPSEDNIKELFPENFEHVSELKKLNQSLKLSFIELIEILINYPNEKIKETRELSIYINPEEEEKEKFAWELKIEQIHLLLINLSYILNTYRPHQSRHQIIEILKNQLKKRIDTIKELNDTYNINLDILSKINFDFERGRKK